MTSPPVGIGDVVAGKYVIEDTIGEGGMGVVFAARHNELERRVAIKFLLPEFAEQGMAAERFRREARAAARMRGEHVCRVLDVGTLETGVPFMVMELLEGRDLASELARRHRLPLEEAVAYVLEACEALAEAHVAGIIHRDLKPANLFLETRSDGSRRIKVLDFGVSKSLLALKDGNGELTKTSSLVGSPLYMSPEQLDSARDVDARADVWALGVVLFELLTGATPFQGDTIPQLVAAVLQETPVRMTDLPVPLPQAIIDILQRALAKQRERRYASVAELAQALAPFAMPNARLSAERVRRLMDMQALSLPLDQEPAGGSRPSSQPRTPRVDTRSRSDSKPAAAPATRSAKWGWAALGIGLAFMMVVVVLYVSRHEVAQSAAQVEALPGAVIDAGQPLLGLDSPGEVLPPAPPGAHAPTVEKHGDATAAVAARPAPAEPVKPGAALAPASPVRTAPHPIAKPQPLAAPPAPGGDEPASEPPPSPEGQGTSPTIPDFGGRR
jgi:serine/threonine protein kinase